MASKTFQKRDYILVLLQSLVHFLTIKNIIPTVVYLVIAVLVSIYFFPIKLLLENKFLGVLNKKKAVLALSYFVISNIITLTALTVYLDSKGFLYTALLIYSLINFAFLLYFHFKENMRYNFILAFCVVILTSSVVGLQY